MSAATTSDPVKFHEEARQVYLDGVRQGLRPGQAAHNAGVSRWAVAAYRRGHPEFAELEKDAALDSVELVEDALFQAAVSGNVTACQVWLYNRAPDSWRDMRARDALAVGSTGPVTIDDEVRRLVDELAAAAEADRGNGQPSG